MPRNRASAKTAGTRFERAIADYLAEHVDPRIDRRVKTGAKDRGDLGGLMAYQERVVAECKDYGGRLLPGQWMTEADTERGNDDAVAGVVIAKRRGVTDPGAQWVLMTVRDLAALMTGQRPEED